MRKGITWDCANEHSKIAFTQFFMSVTCPSWAVSCLKLGLRLTMLLRALWIAAALVAFPASGQVTNQAGDDLIESRIFDERDGVRFAVVAMTGSGRINLPPGGRYPITVNFGCARARPFNGGQINWQVQLGIDGTYPEPNLVRPTLTLEGEVNQVVEPVLFRNIAGKLDARTEGASHILHLVKLAGGSIAKFDFATFIVEIHVPTAKIALRQLDAFCADEIKP